MKAMHLVSFSASFIPCAIVIPAPMQRQVSTVLSGAALLEIIYGWPGLGNLMLTAVRSKDIYLVMASFVMSGVLFLLGNLFADILLAKCDPRIRYD